MNIGNLAEQALAEKLKREGYKIIDTNWRNKYVEIDIIAKKDKTIYFFESKYRSNSNFGEGNEYINRVKLNKMRLGAEMWVESNNWDGEYQLMVASISGQNFENVQTFEIVD